MSNRTRFKGYLKEVREPNHTNKYFTALISHPTTNNATDCWRDHVFIIITRKQYDQLKKYVNTHIEFTAEIYSYIKINHKHSVQRNQKGLRCMKLKQ